MKSKAELVASRVQGQGQLRATTGQAERFTVRCACAGHDRVFTASFAHLPPARQFRCENSDKAEHASAILQSFTCFLRPSEMIKVAAADIDFARM